MSQLQKDGRVHIGAFIDREQRDQLRELAARRDRSVSSIIRLALTDVLDKEEHAGRGVVGATGGTR
jgi:predicted transcriptional regulator